MAVRLDDPGLEYLETLPQETRRSSGVVYTPSHLVAFVLDQGEYEPTQPIESATILDPACGAGAFLEAAVERLAARLKRLGSRVRGTGRRSFLQCVTANLFGVDVDPSACVLARNTVLDAVHRHSPGPLPPDFFERNIVCADFLTSTCETALPPACAGGFAFVVGNPPYVAATRLSNGYKERLRRLFVTATGRLDLYTLFIEKSLRLLGAQGKVALVTPDKFLLSGTSRPLRRFILDVATVKSVAQFRSHRVFEDAATVPCVFALERGGRPTPVVVLSCGEKPGPDGNVTVLSTTTVPHGRLTSEAWQLMPPALMELARRLQDGRPTLETFTVRISAGPATGNDGVYVGSASEMSTVEPELLRDAVRGRDITTNTITNPGLRILVPYTFRRGVPELIDLQRYPRARAFLLRHKAVLQQRHCVRVWQKRWYDLHDQPSCDLARQAKILVPDVAEHNRFAVDDAAFFPLHSVYYVLPRPGIDPHFLVAVLNSTIIEFLIRLVAPVVKDGFGRYRRQFLAALPIPNSTDREIRALALAGRERNVALSNELASKLFALSSEDGNAIRQFLASVGGTTKGKAL